MKIIEKEFNLLTNEETVTEREETLIEKNFRLKVEAEAKIAATEAEAKAIQKAALLAKLGISESEAALLLS
jgi:hypothetical protein